MNSTDLHQHILTYNLLDYSQGLRARFQLDGSKLATSSVATSKPQPYADIGYEVDEGAFHRRCGASLGAGNRLNALPEGWPTKLEGPLVWSKGDFQDEAQYVYHLNDADKEEILAALEHFKGSYFFPSF
jgi:hypothetical protein